MQHISERKPSVSMDPGRSCNAEANKINSCRLLKWNTA